MNTLFTIFLLITAGGISAISLLIALKLAISIIEELKELRKN